MTSQSRSSRRNYRETGFASETRALLRVALARRRVDTDSLRRAEIAALESIRDTPPGPWVVAEREAALRRLAQLEQSPAVAPPVAGSATPSATGATAANSDAERAATEIPAAIAPEDRSVYQRVQEEFKAGRFAHAREIGLPLFARYPKEYRVQDLRCQIALGAGLPFDEARKECDSLMQLAPSTAGKPGSKH